MSRGPGHIERAIEALFAANPSCAYSTDELVAAVYRGVNRIEKKHRVAVLRAADAVAKRLHWGKWKCERAFHGGEGRGAIYLNLPDVRSYALGRLRSNFLTADQSTADLVTLLDTEIAALIAEGGAWWLHVEEAKAKYLGHELKPKVRELIEQRKREFEALTNELGEAFGVDQKRRDRIARIEEANAHGKICARCGKAIEPTDPIARVHTRHRGGYPLELRCMECAGRDAWITSKCEGCERKVYQLFRINRMRTFCCEDCRQRRPRP